MTVDRSLDEAIKEFQQFSEGCHQDMRYLGMLIIQMMYRRPFTIIEQEKFSNILKFNTSNLNEIVSLNKLSPTLKRIIEICFDPIEYDDLVEAKKYGARIIHASVNYHREIRYLRMKLKSEVTMLFNDFLNEPKPPPFWTQADEENRIKEDTEQREIIEREIKKAQSNAIERVNEERKKVNIIIL